MKHTKAPGLLLTIFLLTAAICALPACAAESAPSDSALTQPAQEAASDEDESSPSPESSESALRAAGEDVQSEPFPGGAEGSGSNILIAYFSRAGENYNVGVIEKGNTSIVADIIARETGGELFEIVPADPYPEAYDECTEVAMQEQNENARPEILNAPADLDGYDTVFVGYPIWWGDLPMAVYTFLESYDFSGKTLVPFCTHEGSGLSATKQSIEDACEGAAVLEGLAIRGSVAQNEQKESENAVAAWLEKLGMQNARKPAASAAE